MPTSVLERIAVEVLTALQGVTTANGYTYGLRSVVRASGNENSVAPFTAVIYQLPGSDVEAPLFQDERKQLFAVVVYVPTGEGSTVPVDTYCNELAAAMHVQIMANRTWGGLAVDTTVLPSITFPAVAGDKAGFTFQFEIDYRTAIDNPFTAGNN